MEEFNRKVLLEAHPLVDIDCEHATEDVLDLRRHGGAVELEGLCLDIPQHVERVLSCPGKTVLEPHKGSLMLSLVVIHEVEDQPQ